MTETHMNELLAVALQAAKSARELILSYYNGDFDIEIKSDQTPVTVADRGAERLIRKTINDAFPDHGVFGEEYGAQNKDTEYLWLVDPIDGTKSFVKRYGMFSTQIALMHKGELVLGGATDGYLSRAGRGSFARIEDTLARALQMFPWLSNLRMLRHWSGTADIPMDGNAIVGATSVDGLFLNCGWGYAGFKATPAVGWHLAETLASGTVPDTLQPFSLARFAEGALIDDSGIGPYPWRH